MQNASHTTLYEGTIDELDVYEPDDVLNAYKEGYHQAEKDLALTWVNVNDRLPKEEFDDGYTFVFVRIRLDKETYRFDVDYIRNGKWELHPNDNITHWMPIPSLANKAY